jgi:hypothetical protein
MNKVNIIKNAMISKEAENQQYRDTPDPEVCNEQKVADYIELA